MAKIRGFKPNLWTDEDFVELSPFARLLWLGMWNYACDNGHLADKSKQIKLRILPTDDVNCADLLREIESAGLIRRENGTITIPNFARHQKPDKRYFQTCELVPDCTKPGDSQPETRGGHHEARSGHTVRSWGPRGDGDGDGEVMVKGSDGERRAASKRATSLPDTFKPTDKHQELATELGIDLHAEWPKFADHHRAKGSTFKDWDAALRNWLRNAATFRRGPAPAKPRVLPDVHDLELPPDGLTPTEYAAWEADRRARQNA